MSLENEMSEDSSCNPKISHIEGTQIQDCVDKGVSSGTIQEQGFDVNAHGHKPTQIASFQDQMGDFLNYNKNEDTNAGNVTEEDPVRNRSVMDSCMAEKTDSFIEEKITTVTSEPCETNNVISDNKAKNQTGSEPVSNLNSLENQNSDKQTQQMNPCSETDDPDVSSSYGEYKEISSEEDDHEDLTEKIDAESSTSTSPSQISPDHRHMKGTEPQNERQDNDDDDETDVNPERPGSLSLPRPLQYIEKQKYKKYHKRGKSDSSFASDVSHSSSTDALIEEASKTPLTTKGTVTKDGDMIAFVAEGLNDLIKLSSPLSQTGSSMSSSLRSPGEKSVSSVSSSTSAWSDVTSSASEWSRDYSRMSRAPRKPASQKQTESPSILTASPDDIPPVDPRAVMDLEMHAVKVADSVDHMMGTLKNNLYKMSALSFHCLDAHKDAVDNTCDSVDASIKCMYALMAKCEELSTTMKPVYALQTQVKEIERLLDLFEGQIAKEDK